MSELPHPRVSVVVPVYQVEAYLEDCLTSLRAQTFEDFEAVLVDDGSTDGSRAIAERAAAADARLRIVAQPNGGLGRARNTGVDAAAGEFLLFLDSDDLLPPRALERLVGTLDRTGSDFASGMVHRFTSERTWPAPFLRRTFLRTRRRVHVTRFPWLLVDRMAQNKLWRRSFWDAHGLRFPEGVVYEDTPVTIPAHHLARAVDVLAAPVYLWRVREEGELSITQRRTDLRTLEDRVAAVTQASAFLARHGPPGAKRAYDEVVVAEDLRFHLDVLDSADDRYRARFLELANGFLDAAEPGIESRLAPIQRLKWHLVRQRRLPELLETLRFEQGAYRQRPKVRRGLRMYADYPYFEDPTVGVPRAVYRLDTVRRRLRTARTFLRSGRAR